jgi:hypothetical protein
MCKRLTEFPDRREWNLSGFTVDQICFDFRISLVFAQPAGSVTITIGEPFKLRDGLKVEVIDPSDTLSGMSLLPLLHEHVAYLIAFRSGRLLLQFQKGTEIEVPIDEGHEAWETFGDGETASIGMLCIPGGGVPWGSRMVR